MTGMKPSTPPVDVVFFGTYDTTKPRQRILMNVAAESGATCREVHVDIWKCRDKSRAGLSQVLATLVLSVIACVSLLARYILTPKHAYVVIGYPGLLDLFVAYPIAKLKGAQVVFDNFLSPYEMLVEDRQLFKAGGIAARLIKTVERLTCSLVDVVITDTETHADYLHSLLGINRSKIKTIYVGAEKIFHRSSAPVPDEKRPLNIFFFGQIAPLHGFDTIASAALKLKDRHDITWTIAGGAPSDPEVQQLLTHLNPEQLNYQQWLDYDALVELLCRSDVCLGVFGASPKTQRVIPNKVFQALATGCPIITAHTPAIEELLNQGIHPRIMEIAASNPDQLVAAITLFVEKKQRGELTLTEPIDFTPLVLKQFRETFRGLAV